MLKQFFEKGVKVKYFYLNYLVTSLISPRLQKNGASKQFLKAVYNNNLLITFSSTYKFIYLDSFKSYQ